MRAVIYDRYGPPEVLRLAEVDEPTPRADELLVRVEATAVTRADCATREANRRSGLGVSLLSRSISGIRRPRQPVLGSEFAGTVEAVGTTVQAFNIGDRVFGTTGFGFGAYAERLCVPESAPIAIVPEALTFADAAAVTDGGLNALWCLFTSSGATYDVILDAVGKLTFSRCRRSLRPHGSYLATDGFRNLPLALTTAHSGTRKVKFSIPPRYAQADVLLLKELLEAGEYRPVVDRTYPFEDVIEATRYVETERKTGNVVLVDIQPDLS